MGEVVDPLEQQEIYIETILLANNGAFVTFNVPPFEAFRYIPGIERTKRLKNQTMVFFPWVFTEWIVLESMRKAILQDVGNWVYTENDFYVRQLTYRYVFFSGLKQHHAPDPRDHYRHRRVRSILKVVKL
jgi:hypothetical protein